VTLKKQVTVIGLGSMGWGAAISLLRAGFEVSGVDIRETVLQRFAEAGGTAYATPAEAGAGDIVFVFVVNADQVREVLFGPKGAVAAAAPGTIFVVCVTMAPGATEEISSALHLAGMRMIDAPVSGGAQKALLGEMTIMASGCGTAFAGAQAALDAVARQIFRLGDQPGAGSRYKMINQLLAGVHIAAAAEALTLAAKIGLDLQSVYEVIKVSAGASWMFENRGAHIVDGDYTSRSAVDIFVKDLGIVTREASEVTAVTPLAEQALALFREAHEQGFGHQDDASVAKVLAVRSGIVLPGMEP
jgi:3-hydroxyisobutyrate dehydrogenase